MLHKSLKINSISKATVVLLERLGNDIRLATPLGLGKPNQLLNAIYKSVEADKNKKLKIFTALSLQIPSPPEELAQKFLKPFAKRHWGENYPDLCYAVEATQNKLASNIEVHEFYFQAGIALKSPQLQRASRFFRYKP